MKRTINNCKLTTKFGCTPDQNKDGCEGFCHSDYDDEPCDTCKKCKLHYLYKEE